MNIIVYICIYLDPIPDGVDPVWVDTTCIASIEFFWILLEALLGDY